MKKVLILLSIVLVGVFCAKKDTRAIKLTPLKWADNEINKYQVIIAGQPSGSYRLSIKLGQQTIELTSLTEVKFQGAETRDSTVMVLRQDNLRPVSSSKKLITRGTILNADITYSKDKASIKAITPMGEKSVDIPITINHFDNDEVTTLFRALEIKLNEEKELSVVTGLGGTSIPVKIKALAVEKITVPAGEFECNKYQMSLAGRLIDVWYEKTGMKRMVKYYDSQSNMAMELLP